MDENDASGLKAVGTKSGSKTGVDGASSDACESTGVDGIVDSRMRGDGGTEERMDDDGAEARWGAEEVGTRTEGFIYSAVGCRVNASGDTGTLTLAPFAEPFPDGCLCLRARFDAPDTGTDDCVPDGPGTFDDRLFFVFLDRGGGVGDEVDARVDIGVDCGAARLGALRPRVEVVGVLSASIRLRLPRVFDDGGPWERIRAMSRSGVDASAFRVWLRVRGRVYILLCGGQAVGCARCGGALCR